MSESHTAIDLHAHLPGSDPSEWPSAAEIVAAMDEARIRERVLSVPPSQASALASVRALNDALADLVATSKGRLRGLAAVPHEAIGEAPDELVRAVNRLSLSGAVLDSHFRGAPWDKDAAEPLFAKADELGAVLFFHPSTTLVTRRMNRYGVADTIGPQLESTALSASLLLGGVMARHPRLKALIAHAGGYVNFGVGRMDRGWTVRSEARRAIGLPPSNYLDRLYFDSLTWNDRALRFLIDTVGSDQVVLGSDWSDPLADADPVDRVTKNQFLNDLERSHVLTKTAEALLSSG